MTTLTTAIGTNVLANLAKPLFAGGPQDVVATPDIYQINSNNVINTPVGRFSSFDGSSLLNSFVQGSTGFLSTITQSATLALGSGASVSSVQSQLTNRIKAVAGQTVTSLEYGLQNIVAQNVAGIVSEGISGAANLIETTVGGVTQTVNVSNYAQASQSIQLANQLSGNSNLITINDVGASSALLSGITNQLLTLGLTAAVASLINSTSSTMKTATQKALGANVQTAIGQSDLASIQLCIDQLGVGGVLTQMPNAALALMKGYHLPTGTTSDQYATLATTFLGIINQLAPGWDTVTRGSTSLTSLTYFAQASQDALTLLKTQSDYVVPCLIASQYPPQAMLTALRQEYPSAATL